MNLFRGAIQDLMRRPAGNVPALDLLRSMAILLVFTAHFGGDFQATPRVSKLPMFYFGWSGVDLFFVLSGLLIGTQLWRELQKTGHIRIGQFLLRRGLRIWPLYFFFIVLMLGEVVFAGRPADGLLADTLFVSNYFHNQIGGGWSLSTEEQFYILAPLTISILAWKIKPERLWALPVVAFCLPAAARAVSVVGTSLSEHDVRQQMYFPIHTHSEGLAVGMLLAWLAVFRPGFLRPKPRAAIAAGMLVGAVALYSLDRVLFNFSALALIFGAATCYGMVAPAWGVVSWRGFYLISRLSYGVYLNHFGLLPRLHALLGGWRERGGDVAFWLCYLICFLACMAFAAFTFQLVEWPFLQIRSRWLKRKKADRENPVSHPA